VKKHITIVSNTSWTVYNFRKEIINSLLKFSYEVSIVTSDDGYKEQIEALGCNYIELPVQNSSLNPFDQYVYYKKLKSIYRELKPDAVLHYTIKPVIYGSLASASLNIPTINNIAGLGTLFTKKTWKTFVAMALYRISQRKVKRVFFQNEEDQSLFLSQNLIPQEIAKRINGSGVDLGRFNPNLMSTVESNKFTFLFTGRILWDKGIGEYIRAARVIKQLYPNSEFKVMGIVGFNNPSAATEREMDAWEREGVITYLGRTDDVVKELRQVDCVVLPSYYREGVPRSLIEAAAMKLPIITTDHIGCRDIVQDGYNGFLVQKRNAHDLVLAMEKILLLSQEELRELGENGRILVEEKFDVNQITEEYLKEIRKSIV
jgi:glycosyltransferase involved in cell wall biosynthesis